MQYRRVGHHSKSTGSLFRISLIDLDRIERITITSDPIGTDGEGEGRLEFLRVELPRGKAFITLEDGKRDGLTIDRQFARGLQVSIAARAWKDLRDVFRHDAGSYRRTGPKAKHRKEHANERQGRRSWSGMSTIHKWNTIERGNA